MDGNGFTYYYDSELKTRAGAKRLDTTYGWQSGQAQRTVETVVKVVL